LAVIKSLIGFTATSNSGGSVNENDDEWKKHQEPLLIKLLATELNVDTSDIVDFDLNLYDVHLHHLVVYILNLYSPPDWII
jgi:aspartyl aminopeptidase